MKATLIWDIFCQVIDNYGDLGVCWRLATQLAQRQQTVRLWIDDASALNWMAPNTTNNITVYAWPETSSTHLAELPKADVWIEAFGCDIPRAFIEMFLFNDNKKIKIHSENINHSENSPHLHTWPVWINLEYLSAEPYVERCHQLPSPVMNGLAVGATKYFFYPGFTPHTGGLLREHDLAQQQAVFDKKQWLATHHIPWQEDNEQNEQNEQLISLFCYEPKNLGRWLTHLAEHGAVPTRVLVTHGRAQHAVAQAVAQLQQASTGWGHLKLHYLPPLSQLDYDRLLWSCDVNMVRGEDSLVRAIWAKRPFVWHIYPQDDGAHWDKLHSFLELHRFPAAWRALHVIWNQAHPHPVDDSLPWSPHAPELKACLSNMQQHLWQQTDLCEQLQAFVFEKQIR